MKVIDSLEKHQYEELFLLYLQFFNEINDKDVFSEKLNAIFSKRKVNDAKKNRRLRKYYYAIDSDNKVVGFIYGRVIDDVGLICHTFVDKAHRDQAIVFGLYKHLSQWFKEKGVKILEAEVSKDESINKSFERANWQLYKEFDDANVYQKGL